MVVVTPKDIEKLKPENLQNSDVNGEGTDDVSINLVTPAKTAIRKMSSKAKMAILLLALGIGAGFVTTDISRQNRLQQEIHQQIKLQQIRDQTNAAIDRTFKEYNDGIITEEQESEKLSQIGTDNIEFLLNRLTEHIFSENDTVLQQKRNVIVEAMAQMDPKVVDSLISYAHSGGFRFASIYALGALRNSQAIDPLLKLLKEDENPYIRKYAAFSLGRFYKEDKVVKALIQALHDPFNEVRGATAEALGSIGDPQGVDPLLKLIKEDPDPEVRVKAAQSLGCFSIESRALEALIYALNDPSKIVRQQAAAALANFKDHKIIDPLLKLSKEDPDEKVRVTAIGTLFWYFSKEHKVIESLVQILNDPQEKKDVLIQAIMVLGDSYNVPGKLDH
jgi:hypothetical protein